MKMDEIRSRIRKIIGDETNPDLVEFISLISNYDCSEENNHKEDTILHMAARDDSKRHGSHSLT